MVLKKSVKTKIKKPIKQKQSQRQIQNVNQIVRIYLDERRSKKVKKTAPRKKVRGVGSSNININIPTQNPFYNMYPLSQPYNPHFYPRQPTRQSTRQSTPSRSQYTTSNTSNTYNYTAPSYSQDTPYTAPSYSQDIPEENILVAQPTPQPIPQPFIPPNINVPTNPLIAEMPVNQFPNLQNDNSDLPFFNENDTLLPIVNNNVIDIMNPQSVNIEDEAIDNTIYIPTDTIPYNNQVVNTTMPLMDNTQDTLAEDFNSGLEYSRDEDPADLLFLPPPIDDEDVVVNEDKVEKFRNEDVAQENDEQLVADEALAEAMIDRSRLLEILGGRGGSGRPPTTLKGFLKSNERLRSDVVKMREIDRAD